MANSCINEKFELSYDSIKMMKIPININEYSIQKVVTESQFCLVVSASNTKNSQKVAIKFIPIKYFQRDGKEDLIMRQLNHPNIIKLIDSFLYPIKKPNNKLINIFIIIKTFLIFHTILYYCSSSHF